MTKAIYLDYAASTPIDKKVLEAMMPYLKRYYGNPSSAHSFGQKARAAIEQARERATGFLGCKAAEVVFTGGATEANNLAIQGVIKSNPPAGGQNSKPHIVMTAIEHESVLEPCRTLEREGIAEVTYVKPQKDGIVRAEDVEKAIQPNTVLVSIMYANSEIGTIQPIAEIAKAIRSFKSSKFEIRNSKLQAALPLVHTDAVQAANFLDCDVQKLGVDLLTLSGHKIYGPKGVGVLYVREGVRVAPVVQGGGQETGLRSGTENVAAIVGMGQALEALGDPRMAITNIKIRQLRDKLIKTVLRKVPDCELTGSAQNRLPNNVHFRFRGVEGRDVVIALDQKGIAASTGSACSEKTQEPSHVLVALGLEEKESLSALRLTLGKYTKAEDIEKAVRVIAQTVAQLRKAVV
ncbi:MAG: cysteine desulfurase [Candidatus Wildermuthbacteria bacterium]|nr:cysteine desulfurase [Candidatus Wildermuthbacteria bacterium]